MSERFPAHRAHEGVWIGTYRHLDAQGAVESMFASRVTCSFPKEAEVFYRQVTELTDASGKSTVASFDGIDRGDHLYFDSPAFSGRSWETPQGQILLDLSRKDEPGARFVEIIILGEGGLHRARTWHWFKLGKLYRRTLCDESRLA
jgi:hypothetical protein